MVPLLLLMLLQSTSSGIPEIAPLLFDAFPALPVFHGSPFAPVFQTAGQRLFRTRIREASKKGSNFAGHYTIAEWGCGTSCVSIAIIDAKTGIIYDGPFGKLPFAVLSYGRALQYDRDAKGKYLYDELSYKLSSRLMVARGCPNEENCATYFYEWTGSEFKLLQKIPATPGVR
jgi:hypothetical protein